MIKASMSTKKEKYTDFAEHYDYVLKDIDYEEWFHYLKELCLYTTRKQKAFWK